MIADQVREFLHAASFQRFTMHLADGKSVVVEHPDFAAFTPDYQMMIVGLPSPSGACRAVNLASVTQIEGVLPEPA